MQKCYPYLLLLTLFFYACSGSGGPVLPEERILGNWRLISAGRQNTFSLNYQTILTGYDTGLYVFRDNGTAEYRDTVFSLNGNWTLFERNMEVRNADSSIRRWTRLELELRMYNFQQNRFIDWYFDSVELRYNNRMEAYINRGIPRYRYIFVRQ
jgi:hypothetical protein